MSRDETDKIMEILKTLPVIRRIIIEHKFEAGKPELWDKIKHLCEPLGLTDTAFREHPALKDYMINYDYWEKKLADALTGTKEEDK